MLDTTQGEARKLLSFKLAPGGAFQHGETRLSGARDGEGCGKFRGIYGLRRRTPHALSALGARDEIGGAGRLPMLEAGAAKPARR